MSENASIPFFYFSGRSFIFKTDQFSDFGFRIGNWIRQVTHIDSRVQGHSAIYLGINPLQLLYWNCTFAYCLCVRILTFCTAWPASLWSPQQTALNCNHLLQLNPVYRDPAGDIQMSIYAHRHKLCALIKPSPNTTLCPNWTTVYHYIYFSYMFIPW